MEDAKDRKNRLARERRRQRRLEQLQIDDVDFQSYCAAMDRQMRAEYYSELNPADEAITTTDKDSEPVDKD